MAKDVTICVGTLGQGIWRTGDGGNSWARIRKGIYGECAVRALAVHPRDSRVMYAGTDVGIYRSETRGEGWEMLDSPMNEMQIWSIAIDPVDPDIIFAGTRPGALFRTKDGGLKWDSLSVEIAEECPAVLIPRVTVLAGVAREPWLLTRWTTTTSGRGWRWTVCAAAATVEIPGSWSRTA